jgi:hypothetical protein
MSVRLLACANGIAPSVKGGANIGGVRRRVNSGMVVSVARGLRPRD